MSDTERLAGIVTSETAQMKILETTKAEKVRLCERFLSVATFARGWACPTGSKTVPSLGRSGRIHFREE